jgi:cold shock CspA family protein
MEMNGKMLWFNAAKGFGQICTEDDERLHVAASAFEAGELPEGRCAGREVVFEFALSDGEKEAVNVRFAAETASRRARVRQGSRPR